MVKVLTIILCVIIGGLDITFLYLLIDTIKRIKKVKENEKILDNMLRK